MTEQSVSLAFFDPQRGVHGTLWPGVSLLFEGAAGGVREGAETNADGGGYQAVLDGSFDLLFQRCSPALALAGETASICRVSGTFDGVEMACIGTITEAQTPPAWSDLDIVRRLSAVFDHDTAVLAIARRERGAAGHGDELISACLLVDGEPLALERTRISTVYDGEGRQRSAGLELLVAGEDLPRRAVGTVLAGTTLELEGLRANAAIFSWRMKGVDGIGAYDMLVRDDPPDAA